MRRCFVASRRAAWRRSGVDRRDIGRPPDDGVARRYSATEGSMVGSDEPRVVERSMMATAFCPRCGTPRTGALRFCRSCAHDFDALPASPSSQGEASGPPSGSKTTPTAQNQAATFGGIAWIACAGFTGYLALQQLNYAQVLTSAGLDK